MDGLYTRLHARGKAVRRRAFGRLSLRVSEAHAFFLRITGRACSVRLKGGWVSVRRRRSLGANALSASSAFLILRAQALRKGRGYLNLVFQGGAQAKSLALVSEGDVWGLLFVPAGRYRSVAIEIPRALLGKSEIAVEVRVLEGWKIEEALPERLTCALAWTAASPAWGSETVPVPKARVLMSGYYDFRGPGMKHLHHFANGLRRRGIEVLVLIPREPAFFSLMAEGPLFGLAKIDYRGIGIGPKTEKLIAEFKPDIVHIWTPRLVPSLVAEKALEVTGARLIIHYEDNEETVYKNFFQMHTGASPDSFDWTASPDDWEVVYPPLAVPLNRRACCFTAICKPLAQQLEKEWGKRAFLLYGGADLRRFRPSRKKRRLLSLYGLKGKKVLLFSGSVTENTLEDCGRLVEALRALRDGGREVVLVQCGEDHMGGALQERATRLGMEGDVRFLGAVEHKRMHEILALADVLVQPGSERSFNEFRLPAKVPEYMGMGKPLLLFRWGIGEEFLDGEDVLKLETSSAEEMAAKIGRVLDDPLLAARLGRGARRKAVELFDWERNTDLLEALYKRVMAGEDFRSGAPPGLGGEAAG